MKKEIEKENKLLIRRINNYWNIGKINFRANFDKNLNKILRVNWSIIICFKIKQRYLAINKKFSEPKYKKYANDEWLKNKVVELNNTSICSRGCLNRLKKFRKTEFTDNEIKKYITNIDYKNKGFRIARAILECIELKYEDSANEYRLLKKSENPIEVEHIYPKTVNPKDDSYNCQRDKLWCLGNLSLLEKAINSKIKNWSFKKKKNKYCESKLQITKEVCSDGNNLWTDATIEGRGIDLANQFIEFGE